MANHRPIVPIYLREDDRLELARSRFKTVLSQEKYHADAHVLDVIDNSYLSNDDDDMGERTEPDKDDTCMGSKKFPFIMKLFDRSIDVSQFKDTTPLYPVCREWLKDRYRPKNKRIQKKIKIKKEVNAEGNVDEEPDVDIGIYCLPRPLPARQTYDMYGARVSCRVPPLLPRQESHKSIWEYIQCHESGDDDGLPSPALLFRNHLNRWILTRQQWKKTYAKNDLRYKDSFAVIRRIYKQTN